MKKFIYIFIALFIFCLSIKVVNAMETSVLMAGEVQLLDDCNSLFGEPSVQGSVAYYLQTGLDIIKYLGIILCIFLTIVDFAKALFSDDKDMFKPLSKKALTRLFWAVMLFFLPIIVELIMNLTGAYSSCGIQ